MRARKGTIDAIVNTGKMQVGTVHGIADELDAGVEQYAGDYGFTSHPRKINADGKGAEVIMIDCLDANNNVVVAREDRRYRPVMANSGDIQVYHYKDDPTKNANDALARITFTDDATANYRLVVKVNKVKIEAKSNNDITILNENASIVILANGNITINGKAMVINCDTLDINKN